MLRRTGTILAVLISVALYACLMGPDYERPETPEKAAWAHEPAQNDSLDQIIQIDWWTNFNDPYLNQLIKQSLEQNPDIKILLARIDEAGAALTTARAGRLPTVDVTAGADYSRTAIQGVPSAIDIQSYRASADVAWELDIWGKNKRAFLASEAGYKASQANYRAGCLKLVSDIAVTYFILREIDEKLDIRERFYNGSLQKFTIYQNQYQEGLVADWKVSRQEAEVKGLQQGLLELERIREINENRLATLLGKPAGDLDVPRANLRDHLQPVIVPVGLPSDLLTRRPDIVAAEYYLVEATHLIGVASAARLPSISLTANAGLTSTALSSLLNQWSLGIAPTILAPLFDAGRRQADLRASEARAQIAYNEYIKTVMDAFEEVENALVNLSSRSAQKVVVEEKVNSLESVHEQTMAKFREGLITQLEVLDADSELLSAENESVETHRLLLDDTVTLYKSLGGGWPQQVVQ